MSALLARTRWRISCELQTTKKAFNLNIKYSPKARRQQALALSSSLVIIGAVHGLNFRDLYTDLHLHRSLVTKLGAAEKFTSSHLSTPKVKEALEGASTFYMEGYFLTHGLESALIVAKHASENNKVRRIVSGLVITDAVIRHSL